MVYLTSFTVFSWDIKKKALKMENSEPLNLFLFSSPDPKSEKKFQ